MIARTSTPALTLYYIFIVVALFLQACKKLVDTPPPTDTVAETNVYSTDATAIAVLNGLYIRMNSNIGVAQGLSSIGVRTGLSADEYQLFSAITAGGQWAYYSNTLSQTLGGLNVGHELWPPLYQFVFSCNAAIHGLNTSTSLSPRIQQQLLGESYFLRAFYYFYLVNLFGDLPLVVSTDPDINVLLPRSPVSKVYDLILSDLQLAADLLSPEFPDGTLLGKSNERIRPTIWAAKALQARVYLYTNNYDTAIEKASQVINEPRFQLTELNRVFLKTSPEAIWQLQPTRNFFNTEEATVLVLPATGPSQFQNPVYLSRLLLNNFEPGDRRVLFGNWVDTCIYQLSPGVRDTVAYSYKYKLNASNPNITNATGTTHMQEYFMMLRLGEQYLIRAEARAQQGNIAGAQQDLDSIRLRAGLLPTTVAEKDALLAAIAHERQVELFSEWGHRWFDLKRTGKVNEVMNIITPLKANGAPWQSYQQLCPLPLQSDLQKAPNLAQNPGYE